MDTIEIHEEQLQAMLDASVRTALTHRGKPYEEYVLGQLEATANFVYVLCVGQSNCESLEQACQQHARSAVERLTEINPPSINHGFGNQSDSRA